MRSDGRAADQLRAIKVTRRFTKAAAGSVLWEQGGTVVWCTASVAPEVPPWFKETRPGGWITAEYVMLPASTPTRKAWPKAGHTDSRGTEIQRLIGRCLRGVIDLSKIGPHTIAVDCQVLQADGGTRTAAVCGAYVALVDALARLPAEMPDAPGYDPRRALVDQLAAVSVGIVDREARLDLDYKDDAAAQVDMNVAYTAGGRFVEVQGSAEKLGGYDRTEMDRMLDLAVQGCQQIMTIQRQALAASEIRNLKSEI
jgi:ribonuclease PH